MGWLKVGRLESPSRRDASLVVMAMHTGAVASRAGEWSPPLGSCVSDEQDEETVAAGGKVTSPGNK